MPPCNAGFMAMRKRFERIILKLPLCAASKKLQRIRSI